MQGMMTLLRVLPPDEYNHIVDLRRNQGSKNPDDMPGTIRANDTTRERE
jgi:hypothetical protein